VTRTDAFVGSILVCDDNLDYLDSLKLAYSDYKNMIIIAKPEIEVQKVLIQVYIYAWCAIFLLNF
jgi:hypothetical protein